jgi:hypothetical protein
MHPDSWFLIRAIGEIRGFSIRAGIESFAIVGARWS